MSLVTVADALVTRLETIDGLRVTDHVPSSPNLPAGWIIPPDISTYHQAFQNGLNRLDFEVAIFVQRVSERTSQAKLMDYADWTGSSSVFAAIEGDDTLGGVAKDTVVRSFRSLAIEEIAAYQMLGGLWTITVILA